MADWSLKRCSLAVAIAFTTVGIVRVGFLPVDAPLPPQLIADRLPWLAAEGWQVSSAIPAQSRERVSNAEGFVLVNDKSAILDGVQLRLIPVRARAYQDLKLESFIQVITGAFPATPTILTVNNDQFMRFRSGSQDLQAVSCILASQAMVSQAGLARALSNSPASLAERIRIILGLQPPRDFSCLLMTIDFRDRSDADQLIRQVWSAVRPVVLEPR